MAITFRSFNTSSAKLIRFKLFYKWVYTILAMKVLNLKVIKPVMFNFKFKHAIWIILTYLSDYIWE